MEPADPMESTLPAEPIDNTDPNDATDKTLAEDATEWIDHELKMDIRDRYDVMFRP